MSIFDDIFRSRWPADGRFLNGEHTRGFTLIEGLVVLIVIATLITFASLSLGDLGQSRRLHDQAEQFVQLFSLARVRAQSEPSTMGLLFTEDSYQFYRYELSNKTPEEGTWQPIATTLLAKKHTLPSHTWLNVTFSDAEKIHPMDVVPIVIFPSGEITPFTLEMGTEGKEIKFRITGKRDGQVQLITDDDGKSHAEK